MSEPVTIPEWVATHVGSLSLRLEEAQRVIAAQAERIAELEQQPAPVE